MPRHVIYMTVMANTARSIVQLFQGGTSRSSPKLVRRGRSIAAKAGRSEPKTHHCLGQADSTGHAIQNWQPMLIGQPSGKVCHSGAAKDDGFGAVFGQRAADLGADAVSGVGAGVFQFQYSHLRRPNPGAAGGKTVFVQVVLQRRHGPRQCRDD